MRVLVIAFFVLVASAVSGRADDAASLTSRWFIAAQLPSGLFTFDVDFLAGDGQGAGTTNKEHTAYIVRQAAGAFALAKYYDRTRDPALRAPLAAAITALGRHSISIDRPWSQRAVEWTGVLSLPVLRVTLARVLDSAGLLYQLGGPGRLLAYEQMPATAWTGGTAIALAAELYYARASGDQSLAGLRAGWLEGLRMRRIPGGGFRDLLDSITPDPYVDGEAWLALALLAHANPAQAPAELAEVDAYMLRTYASVPDKLSFHWSAMAARLRYMATRDPAFVRFVASQMRVVLATPESKREANDNNCARLEGLAAAAAVLREAPAADPVLRNAVDTRLARELEHHRALQIQTGQTRIAFPGGAELIAPQLQEHAGAWLLGRATPSIRADMTGHCLSALIEADVAGGR
jgi:hypothetical protein